MKIRNILYGVIAVTILWSCEPNEPDSIYVNTAPVIKDHSFSAKENISDTYVIGTVTATDEVDNDKITFSITADESGLFEISPSGNLSLIQGKSLDFETQEKHALTVRAFDGIVGRSAEIDIIVENALDGGVELNTYALSMYALPQYAETLEVISDLEGNTVVWSSSDETIATVDENGLVTPITIGTATITATVGNEDTQCSVEVIDGPVTQLEIDLTNLELYTGESETLTIQTLEADVEQLGDPVWGSSDETVATVDQNGLVTAVSAGMATINVTVDNAVASCAVIVNPNVYIAGYDNSGNNSIAVLWKNGTTTPLANGPGSSSANSVFVDKDNNVYVAGYEYINGIKTALLWKNDDDPVVLSNGNGGGAEANAIFVDDTGTTFVAGNESNNGVFNAMLWRNQVANTISDGLTSANAFDVFVDGNDVYLVGRQRVENENFSKAKLWVNDNVDANLTDGTSQSEALSIYVNNGNFYISGYQYIGGSKAMLWQNNNQSTALTTINLGIGNSVTGNGSDIYVGGTQTVSQSLEYLATVWINGSPSPVADSGSVRSVFLYGTDIYLAGYEAPNFNTGIARLWINGEPTDLGFEGSGESIFVK